jgi:TonB-linked SusC/RagA family outer membrane protein
MDLTAFSMPPRRRLTKTLRVMKLTAFFLLATCLHVSAKVRSQQITLEEKDVPVLKVLKEIQRQAGCDFIYTYEVLQRAGNVSIDIRNVSVEEAVAECLKGTSLTYRIEDNTVVILEKPLPRKVTEPANAPPATFHGHVTDTTGAPLEGATVSVKGSTTLVSTDANGNFALRDVDAHATLVVTYIGYQKREIEVNGRKEVFVVLRRSTSPLDEVQIIAYGTTSRRFSVGSISSVNADVIDKQPVTNILLALEGQAPGLAINATSGVPSSRVLVQVRGQNTIMNNTSGYKPYDQPLFIIDGVPFAPQNNNVTQLSNLALNTTFTGGISEAGGLGAFSSINPNDIESITILKDADATSIYGTQGSNGVILITTKKGKAGRTMFDVTVNTGFNTDVRTVKLLNTQQYLQMRNEAFTQDGLTPSNSPYGPTYAPDLLIFPQTGYTDYQKLFFGKTSNNTDVHASLSGGTINNTFLFSGGYSRSDFNYPGSFADQRMTLHTATHHQSMNNRLIVDFVADFGYNQNNSPGFGGSQKMLNPPNTPALTDASGNLVWNYDGVNMQQFQYNAYLKQLSLAQNYNFNNTLHLVYKLMPGLSIGALLGYSRNETSEHSENPASAQSPAFPNPTASFATNTFQTLTVEPQVDYSHKIGQGVFSATVGASYKKNQNYSVNLEGIGYSNDNFLGSLNGAASVFSFDNSSIYKYNAGFARLGYVYDQKYILSLTGNRDGSSNFGPGHQFGNFASAGAGWIFSEEKAFKAALPVISYAKLSGNYGTSGSDGVAPYQYQPFWTAAASYVTSFQNIHPDFPTNLYNPNYSWALKKSLNLALDLGFVHDRVLFNATFYRDREGNQLAGYPLGAQDGFPNVLENVPSSIQNQGWEFAITSNNIKTKSFSWSTRFNITFNRNKLLSFPNLAASGYAYDYVIGRPTSELLGFQYKGVDPTTGLFDYYTAGKVVTNNPNYNLPSQGGDLVPIADREVKYMGGLTNTFSYKRFSLYIFFQFSSQTAPNWLNTAYTSYYPGMEYNQPVEELNFWKKPGDHTELQRLTSSYASPALNAASNFSRSSGAYSDDTYLRLKTAAISYTLPDIVLHKLHLHDCRFYINAQNLLTFTDYKVGDPELFNDYTTFPLQRVLAFGLSLNL